MEIKISFPKIENLCPQCLGSGKLKAMQSALVKRMNGTTDTIIYHDTSVKCSNCDGRGYIKLNCVER